MENISFHATPNGVHLLPLANKQWPILTSEGGEGFLSIYHTTSQHIVANMRISLPNSWVVFNLSAAQIRNYLGGKNIVAGGNSTNGQIICHLEHSTFCLIRDKEQNIVVKFNSQTLCKLMTSCYGHLKSK